MPTSKSRRGKSDKNKGPVGSTRKDFQELLRRHRSVTAFDPMLEELAEAADADIDLDIADGQWAALLQAEEAFEGCAHDLLRAQRMQSALEAAIKRRWCSPDDMLSLPFAVRAYLRSWETSEGASALYAMSLNGVIPSDLPAPDVVAACVCSCIQAAASDQDRPTPLVVRMAPEPVHPLALSMISLDDQYRLRREIGEAGDGPVWRRLREVNREILRQDAPPASDEAVLSSRIWIMVITDRNIMDPSTAIELLDDDLSDAEFDTARWARLVELFPADMQVGSPLPLASAATVALLNHALVSRDLLASAHGLPSDLWDDMAISSVEEEADRFLIGFHHQGDFLGSIPVEIDWLFVGEEGLIETLVDILSPEPSNDDGDDEHEVTRAPMSGNVMYLADRSANKPSRVH